MIHTHPYNSHSFPSKDSILLLRSFSDHRNLHHAALFEHLGAKRAASNFMKNDVFSKMLELRGSHLTVYIHIHIIIIYAYICNMGKTSYTY